MQSFTHGHKESTSQVLRHREIWLGSTLSGKDREICKLTNQQCIVATKKDVILDCIKRNIPSRNKEMTVPVYLCHPWTSSGVCLFSSLNHNLNRTMINYGVSKENQDGERPKEYDV